MPFGRTFDKETGKWFVNERGKRMRQLLERYANGEGWTELLKGFTEFSGARVVLTFINHSQLSGTYVKEFNIPELNIHELKIPVPAIPEVISPELFARVQARMEHRRTWNQEHRRSYVLTGFVRCGHCGKPLTGNSTSGRVYYRHCVYEPQSCVFHSIRKEELADPVLEYLFSFFDDEPTFLRSVERALPKRGDRESLVKEQEEVRTDLAKVEKQIARLIDAIAAGANPGLLITKQGELNAQCERYSEKLRGMEVQLAGMPDAEVLKHTAMAIRLQLLDKVREREWWKLSVEETRRFLIFLFGENPNKTGNGITVFREKGRWRISFKGTVEFYDELSNGRVLSHLVSDAAAHYNKEAKQRVALTRQT